MRHAILSASLFFFLYSPASAKFLTLNEIGEASCRVNAEDSRGSGTSIAHDKQFIYVLTNAHVVGNSRRVTCEFFRYGRKTAPLGGEVVWRAYSEQRVLDFAVIRIPKSLFGSMPPRIVPLAPANHVINKDDYIASGGCPQGRWLQLWEGHALSTGSQSRVLFTPPPLGGQSGSGVYTMIKGNMHLAAVLTWRVDANMGGAIHIANFWRAIKGEVNENKFDKIPSSWKFAQDGSSPKAKKIESKLIRKHAYYALGSNGYYYLQTFKSGIQWRSVIIPDEHPNVKIVQWNVLLDVECPFGICPPFIPPRNPRGPPPSPDPDFTIPTPKDNPDGSPGGDGEGENPFGKVPPNYTPDESDAQIKDLEKRIAELEKERVELEGTIKDLNNSIKSKLGEIESLKQDSEGNREKIEKLEREISDHRSSLDALNGNLSQKNKELEGSLLVINNLKSDAEAGIAEVKVQRNRFGWLSGGLGGILLWIFSMYWKLRGKEKVKDVVEDLVDGNAEDNTSAPDTPLEKEPKESPPDLQAQPDMHALVDFLEHKVTSILDDKLGEALGVMGKKVDSLERKLIEQVKGPSKSEPAVSHEVHVVLDEGSRKVLKDPDPVPEQPHDAHDDCDCDCGENILDQVKANEDFPCPTTRIKQFIDLKAVDGECITELAFYAHLYRDAVGLLRENRLVVQRQGKPFKVHHQQKAANAIDTYVRDQFLKRVSTATIESHALYHEAMIGFLYKESVKKLRRGEFNVLGYKDMAYSIEEWVKTEFLKRMGFQF
jgi:uncharacterized coiled-coil protein SlyX